MSSLFDTALISVINRSGPHVINAISLGSNDPVCIKEFTNL